MKTVILDPSPVEVEQLVERRRRLGLDHFDEVWEGVYHVVPAPKGQHGFVDDQLAYVLRPYADRAGLVGTGQFNLGEVDDFRVPDRACHRRFDGQQIWFPTAALVVEILSPGDETWEKLPFYAAHGVEELLVADPAGRSIRLFRLAGEGGGVGYEETGRSELLGVEASELESAVRWP